MTMPFAADLREFAIPVACVVLLLAVFAVRRGIFKAGPPSILRKNVEPAATSKDAPYSRDSGEWSPVPFEYPPFEPFTGDIATVKPIPYRPFRWGQYHVTMGIRNMPWNEWIEIDQNFEAHHKLIEYRIKTRGNRLVKVHPAQPQIVASGHAAAEELVYELAEYLSRRYPTLYTVTREARSEKDQAGWYGQARIRSITIVPLAKTFDLAKEDPMTVASLIIQEDLAIMIEGTDGRYYLQAGAVCIPGSWRLQDKIGMPLEEIHVTGHVPQYQSKLHLSMSRFFRRLPVDKPVVRNNYGFQLVKPPTADPNADPIEALDPTELSWCRTVHGDEDRMDFERIAAANITTPVDEKEEQKRTQVPVNPKTVYLRSERQTLRRLPRTGAIVFTIRVYQTPVEQLAAEPGVPGRLASAVRGWSNDVAEYKSLHVYKDILQYLDEKHAEQLLDGVITEDVRLFPYPF